jgi:hypothetical protein
LTATTVWVLAVRETGGVDSGLGDLPGFGVGCTHHHVLVPCTSTTIGSFVVVCWCTAGTYMRYEKR